MKLNITKSYWELLEGHRLKAAFLIILSTLSGLLEGVAIVSLVPILSSGLTRADTSMSFIELFNFAWDPVNKEKMLIISLICFFVLGILSAVTKAASEIGTARLRARIELSFRERLKKSLLSMRWENFMSFKMGEISKAMSLDGYMIGMGAQAIIQFWGFSLICLTLSILAFGLSPKMTLATVGFGLLATLVSKRITSLTKKQAPIVAENASTLADSTDQYFSNLKFVKSFGLVPHADETLSRQQINCAQSFSRMHGLLPLVRFSFESLGIIFIGIIVAIAFWVVPSVFGRLIAFLAVFYRIAPRLISIQNAYNQAISNEPWYQAWKKRYEFAASHQEKQLDHQGIDIDSFQELRFDTVQFQYGDRPILKDISFKLPQGKTLALVGESGGGKTTILDLVTGLMDPQGGDCFLNNIPIKEIRLNQWRSKIGLVMQNSPVFHTTALQNITLDDPHPNIEKAEKCAKMAHAWEFIERLPQKWETHMKQKGANLSQGECQRLSLARALYRDPWLLILDEATSALDAQSETYILDTLRTIKKSTTILMVSHRIASVDFADEILVLSNGRIIERGSYQDLLDKSSSEFRRLAQLQGIIN